VIDVSIEAKAKGRQ